MHLKMIGIEISCCLINLRMTLEPLSRRVVVSYVLKYTVRAYPGICTTANANLLPLQETRSFKASKVFRGSQAQREIYVKRVPLSLFCDSKASDGCYQGKGTVEENL